MNLTSVEHIGASQLIPGVGGPMNDDAGVLTNMADAYVAFLSSFPWERPLVVAGAREGLNKFLSNAYLSSFRSRQKHQLTQLISPAARDLVSAGSTSGLVFEHVVPKRRFIQEPCEEQSRRRTLDTEFVLSLLRRYWVLAMVTAAEDRRLTRGTMPEPWDGVDILARYQGAGVVLVANPFAVPGVPPYVFGESPGRRSRRRS